MTVAASVALAYVTLILYAMGARRWAAIYGRVPERPELSEPPPLRIELPSHPHSNRGWKHEKNIHISCCFADPDATRGLDPEVDIGEYPCRDCKAELTRHGEDWRTWVRERNDIVAAIPPTRRRSAWLWPLWVLLRPLEIVGRPEVGEVDE